MLNDAGLPGGTGAIGSWPSGGVQSTPSAEIAATIPGIGGAPGTPSPVFPPHETWGLVTIPTQPAQVAAPGDKALSIYLNFLQAFLQTDQNAIALWSSVAPGRPVVKRIHPHNPSDKDGWPEGLGFSVNDLPCLFMWRQGGPGAVKVEYIAEDWQIAIATMKVLWVFPTSTKYQQRLRQSFTDAIAKCIIDAIELGRTPSYVVPGDPEIAASYIGSFVHSFTGIVSMNATQYGATTVDIDFKNDGSPMQRYAAVEVDFHYEERRIKDPNRWSFPRALNLSVTNVQQPLPNWAPFTVYAQGDHILAGPPSLPLGYVYQATSVSGAGQAGEVAPTWPTATSAAVADGAGGSAITWTCLGTVSPPLGVVRGQG
jgi:hypothetical protein